MPELPEVETLVRQLRARLIGRRITAATLSHDNLLDGISADQLLAELRGRELRDVTRRAKHALLHTDTRRLDVQPGMTGSLLVYDRPLTADEAKYAVLRCPLDDGSELVYRDVRRIGTLRWLDDDAWATYAARLGPEPLDPAFTAEAFADRLGRSRSPIKKVLMDQRFVVGVGNIYATEALFAAGIDPSKPADRVPRAQLLALHGHVARILDAAIRSEGTTFRDYVTSTGTPGNFQLLLYVYGRGGEPCRQCGTRLAETHAIDARSTVFCWRCQA
ncbi:MAG TPA: bifunctional DNA-formamidopyrimidine glycosylase/DNA-(apurinic or apyrimidinic site) lyase [Gemmatimonadales bacterium]|nr:bifunctional DNA-formamidopyrimidine glycosylase/DNA-(apurinic or apyrimidinic site) lyase [Gemmatimonadales bacterium]